MITTLIISGFILGMAGSLHCIGMCGPLSLVLPLQGLNPRSKLFSLLLYQAGRITTYGLMGLAFAFFGRQFFLAGIQQTLSIIVGILILVAALFLIGGKHSLIRNGKSRLFIPARQLFDRIWRGAWMSQRFFLIGMANGLLPCGMIFVALLATLSFNATWHGPIFMVGFGLGTVPAMVAAAYALQRLRPTGQRLMRKVVPYFMIIVGVWIVLRGLDLGIPFISPQVPMHPGVANTCAS